MATLNNAWSPLVNTANPAASPLQVYNISRPGDTSGVGTAGINILMESRGLGISSGNPTASLVPLTSDDFGIRQFLYPAVPEPAVLAFLALAPLLCRRRRRA